MESESECMSVSTFIRSFCEDKSASLNDNNVFTLCSVSFETSDDIDTNTILESVSVTCIHCGKSEINLCELCLEQKPDSEEPPTKKANMNLSKSSNTSSSNPTSSSTSSSSSPYTTDQLEKMKKMTVDEKKAARCNKCGLLFHKAANCKNETRFCYFCHKKGHEKKDCRKLKTKLSKFPLNVSKFVLSVVFLVDSGASHHVYSQNLLFDFQLYTKPIPVVLAKKNNCLFARGEGILPVLVKCGKYSHILQLAHVQFVPELTENFLGV